MNEVVLFLAPAIVMATLLVGIHCYLGLHVLARGVIFVDLALAQVAALGTIVAYIIGYEHHSAGAYFVSLGFTFFAALYLSVSRILNKKISQEVVIGILYAFASAFVILLLEKVSHGAEHLKSALVGQLLWVTWSDVAEVFLIYSGVGFAHYWLREKMLRSSFDSEVSWKWDFIFYMLFGIVITSSVHVAGVLLVFSFLIVPAMLSAMLFQSISSRLIFGWSVGAALSLIGLIFSYVLDLPAGATIVVVFTSVALLMALLVPKISSK